MKRKWVAAALAAGLFAMGACGDDNDGGGDGGDGGNNGGDGPTGKTNEEVCADLETAAGEMDTSLQAAMSDVTAAMESGDQAAALTALQDLQGAVSDFSEALSTGADEAADPETAETLSSAADEIDTALETLDIEAIQAGDIPDPAPLEQAIADVEQLCGVG